MLAYMSLALFEPTEQFLVAITLVLILKSMFTSVQEVAIDAYVVDYTTVKERPKAAGINTAFEAIGQMVALSGPRDRVRHLRMAADGDSGVFPDAGLPSARLFPQGAVAGRCRKSRARAPRRRGWRAGAALAGASSRVPIRASSLPVVVSGGLFTGALFPMIGPFLIDAGFNVTRVGVVTGARAAHRDGDRRRYRRLPVRPPGGLAPGEQTAGIPRHRFSLRRSRSRSSRAMSSMW